MEKPFQGDFMARNSYKSNLSDEQWDELKQYIPPAKKGGRPREVEIREIFNAIFYVNKTGCPWRWLPNDFPPWETVYTYFRDWRLSGVWKKNQRSIEEIFEKTRRKKFSSIGSNFGQSECEDHFISRRNTGFRWWEENKWPQTPHSC